MGRRAFVFNGLIKDLSFPRPLEGRIAVYSHSAGGIAYAELTQTTDWEYSSHIDEI